MQHSRWTFRKGSGRKALISTFTVLVTGLVVAILVALALHRHNREELDERFTVLVSHIAEDVTDRMNTFEHGLRGARGAVIASNGDTISRERFLRYSQSREYSREFPGILGFGYIRRVPRDQEAEFLRQTRADGAPNFRIRQFEPHEGDRFVVLYYQPAPVDNESEGIDIASERLRREAALVAARTGRPTLTMPLQLAGEHNKGKVGFLLLLAVYREDMPRATPEERAVAATGWAVAALSIGGVLEHSIGHQYQVEFSLADAESPETTFYRSEPTQRADAGTEQERTLEIYGRHWLLTAHPTRAFIASLNQTSPVLVGMLIFGGSVLCAALLYLYLANRFRRTQVLRKNSELASLVTHSGEAIVAEDAQGRITHWNPSAELIFGYTAQDALGRELTELLMTEPYVRPMVPEKIGLQPSQVKQMRHADGRTVHVLGSSAPIIDEQGQVIGQSHFLRDVSERVLAQQRIIELNATLEQQVAERTSELVRYSALQRAILAHAGYAIVTTDPTGIITLFNPAAEKLLGYSASEMIGRKSALQYLDPEELERRAEEASRSSGMRILPTFESLTAILSLGRSDTSEWTYVTKDGRRFPVLLTLSTLRDDNDQILGYLGVAVDLTEQKLHEKQLRLAIDAAESANQSKTDFLANMSHEIRTPMNAILGMLYLLQRSELPAAAKDMVQKIDLSARSLLEIINDILDFSKIEAGRIDLEFEPFDLTQLLDNIAGLMSNSLAAKPVEMIVEPPPEGCRWVKGDALRLNQVLINLLGNAIKFTERGEVVLSVRRFQAPDPTKVKLLFSVRDTGIGISKEKQKVIFSPFLQADTSTSRRYGGSGLGLTISRRLVELMGGQLEVESVSGHGSEFYFVVSLEKAEPPALPAPLEIPSDIASAKPRVLIADDHELVLTNLANIANGLGWEVKTVGCGREALDEITAGEGKHFDIFLLDWRMPDIDGLSVAQRIRDQSPPGYNPIIVMVTAYERKLLEQQPGQENVDAIMTKPVTASSLYRIVAGLKQAGTVAGIPQIPPGQPRLAGARLLLVDDSEINCEVAQRILQGEGASVQVAHNGEEALQMLDAEPDKFNLVLMDVQMPLMDGYEATRRMRQDPRLSALPVVALTAGAFRQQQELAMKAGMNGFVAKPFHVEDLVAVIQQFLPMATPGVRLASAEPAVESPSSSPWQSSQPELLDGARAQVLWGEHDPYHRYLLKLLQEFPDPAARVTECVRNRDITTAIAIAHKLRGSAGSLALPQLCTVAGELELVLDEGGDGLDAIAELRETMIRTTAAIREFIDRADGKPADSSAARKSAAPAGPVELDTATHGDAAADLSELVSAFESDDADRIDRALASAAPALPAGLLEVLRRLADDFEFRQAEDKVRQWQADNAQ